MFARICVFEAFYSFAIYTTLCTDSSSWKARNFGKNQAVSCDGQLLREKKKRTMSFRGDGDVMVDALIKASEDQKCASAAPLPGAGRDLVPFDFEAHNQNTMSNYNSSTPLLVGVDPRLRAHQVCAPQVPTGGHAAAAAKLSNSAPLETTTNNGHHTKGNNNNSNKGKSNKNNNNNSTRNDYNEPKYAGASFTNSPDPDVVPLPSFLKTIPGAQAAMARRNSSQNSLSSSAGSSPPTTTASANSLMQNLLSRSPPPQQHQRPPMSGQALLGSLLGGGMPTPPQHHQHHAPTPTKSVLNDLFGGDRNGGNGGIQLQPYIGPDGSQQYPNIPEPANHDFQMMMAKLSGSHR